MAAPFVNYGEIEAPFLIGTMTSCALFGITCAQTAYYYRTYTADHMYRKLLVGILFLLELGHLMLVGEAGHFLYIVSKVPENLTGILFVRSTFAVSFILTVIITSLVQGFYAWRVWSISKSHGWRKLFVGTIIVLSFAQFCLGLTTAAFLFVHRDLASVHGKLTQGLYSSQLATAMICDVVITLALVHFLNKSRSGFHSTENIIDRLIIYSVNVGLVTSAISICTFATFHGLPSTTMFTSFTEIISKIYVNSLLVTLNSRKSIRRVFDNRAAETIPLSVSGVTFTQTKVKTGISGNDTLHPSMDAKRERV